MFGYDVDIHAAAAVGMFAAAVAVDTGIDPVVDCCFYYVVLHLQVDLGLVNVEIDGGVVVDDLVVDLGIACSDALNQKRETDER